MPSLPENLYANLRHYKRKYYLNKLFRGLILLFSVLLVAYLTFNTLEYFGNFNSYFRGVFFFSFLTLASVFGYFWVLEPLYRLFQNGQKLSDEEAALQIGQLLPEVKDKLLNTLQLSKLDLPDSELLQASIAQKTNEMSIFDFSGVIKLEQNKTHLKYLVPPLAIILILLLFIPQLFTEGTKRIIKYNLEFIPEAPFKFILENKSLETFKNEDVELKLRLEGEALPENAYVEVDGRKIKMESIEPNTYLFTFKRIDKEFDFRFEAAGFKSISYGIDLKTRPIVNGIDVKLEYPSYLNKRQENMSNVGNLLLPEGTMVTWSFDAEDCDKLFVDIGKTSKMLEAKSMFGGGFQLKKQILKSNLYTISVSNKFGMGKEKMEYSISVIPDEYPKIVMEQFKDTLLFNYISVGGTISDDYGLSELRFFYKRNALPSYSMTSDFVEKTVNTEFKSLKIPINKDLSSQGFYFKWDIDTLGLRPGESLEYYVSVWDNDGVNGRKVTNSKSFELKLPTVKEMEKSITESSEKAESQMETTHQKAEELKKDVKKLDQKLKGKKQLDWQDKKAIEEMIKKQEALQQEMEQLQEKHQEVLEKKDRFDKSSERIAEKNKLLQQLMNEMLDEETKKMYNELRKLIEEKGKENEIKDIIEKIKNKEDNLEKELDRALEMFKQMKLESKMEDITTKLEELAKKQDELAMKSEDKSSDLEKLKEEQKKANEEFKEAQKDIEELKKMNEELENKKELDDTKKEEEEVAKEQENSQESLEKEEKKKAAKSQKKAAEQLNKMAQQMKKKQQSMEQEEMSENMEDLRAILENLVTLSYDQEEVMKEFKKVNQTDPRFVQLSQKQIKIKDDSKIIEDSLNALAKRVFQIQSFIKRELEDMNLHMDDATKAIKARRSDMAAGKQQFAMTSMNNLALLLSDVLKQMQEQAKDMKPGGSGGESKSKKKSKKSCENGAPSMSQLQKNLNKQIENLKKSGMSGQKMSQELAKLTRQQEQIRNSMKGEMGKQGNSGKPGKEGQGQNGQGGPNGQGGEPKDGKDGKGEGKGNNGKEQGQGSLEQLIKEMEKTEADLVNKQITEQTLQRQQEILSRLLEHENAAREREQDDKRESETAKERNKKIPASFEQYLREKEKQVELLKTIPPALNPYYKKEANEYFLKFNN